MLSDFLVSNPSGLFLDNNQSEWGNAVKKCPNILNHTGLNYEQNTSTGSFIPGQECYCDNEPFLAQFERLIQMLEFKTEYNTVKIKLK